MEWEEKNNNNLKNCIFCCGPKLSDAFLWMYVLFNISLKHVDTHTLMVWSLARIGGEDIFIYLYIYICICKYIKFK